MRTVKVVSTTSGNGVKKVDAGSARTWGELKSILSSNNIPTEGLGATIRQTRNRLDGDSAQLPEGEFDVFLSPEKVKSGHERRD